MLKNLFTKLEHQENDFTKDELQKLQDFVKEEIIIFKDKKYSLNSKYKIIRDNLYLTGEQEILKSWVAGFEDRDNKILNDMEKLKEENENNS